MYYYYGMNVRSCLTLVVVYYWFVELRLIYFISVTPVYTSTAKLEATPRSLTSKREIPATHGGHGSGRRRRLRAEESTAVGRAVELAVFLLPDPRSDRQRHAVAHSGPLLPRLPQQLFPLLSAAGVQAAGDGWALRLPGAWRGAASAALRGRSANRQGESRRLRRRESSAEAHGMVHCRK